MARTISQTGPLHPASWSQGEEACDVCASGAEIRGQGASPGGGQALTSATQSPLTPQSGLEAPSGEAAKRGCAAAVQVDCFALISLICEGIVAING